VGRTGVACVLSPRRAEIDGLIAEERAMGARAGRVVVATVACLLWLNGCETSTKLGDLFNSKSDTTGSTGPGASASFPSVPDDDPKTTGSVRQPPNLPQPDGVPQGLLGNDPKDDLNLGKKQFRAANFGLAERYFRRAVEQHPRDLEAWVGLAASYDRLRRFDLADRAYDQATKIAGPQAEILNNWGYSYMLRGDYRRARETLLQAQAQDPANPYVKNNLELLEASFRKGKAIQ
jgi:tetratricopeptide (TPR) repeat protein